MIGKMLSYVRRSVMRHPVRSFLTLLGVATAMFLFTFIEGLQTGVREATENAATENMLIVYQKNRFCPANSQLPERYTDQIAKIPGVKSVLPVRVFVNNCRASLDSVTFHGVPPEQVSGGDVHLDLVSGSTANFEKRKDAALVGGRLAERRNLKEGDTFQIGNVTVQVAGIFSSDVPGQDNLAYTHLDFLQRTKGVSGLGRVTQFNVTVEDAKQTERISAEIDELFRTDEFQTMTKSHKAFIASALGDLLSLVAFTRWLGLLCVGVVLALTANTVYVMVQDRVKEHAVLQTLGFTGVMLFFMVIAESLLLSLSGGLLGTAGAAAALKFGNLGLGAEGVNVSFLLTPLVIVAGLVVSVLTGVLAGVIPALQAAYAPIVDSLRRT